MKKPRIFVTASFQGEENKKISKNSVVSLLKLGLKIFALFVM